MKLDRAANLAVAKTIQKLNAHATACFTDDSLADYMESMAYRDLADGVGYVGTMGFIMTAYRHPEGGIGVKATVEHWLIDGYLKSLAREA